MKNPDISFGKDIKADNWVEWLVNLVMRAILGILAIHFINLGLNLIGISLGVGINFFTIGILAVLGLPGLIVLYGFGLYAFL